MGPYGLQPTRLLYPWDFSGKNTVVGCCALLQGIFPIQGLNPGLLQSRQILYCLSHQGSPRVLKWVVYPLSRGSSQPRDPTYTSCVSCTGGQFLYHYCRFTVYLSPPSLLILCPAKVLFLIPFESSKGGLALLVQFSSVAQSCPTLCDSINSSTPGLPVHHQLPGFTQTHVHPGGDAIQPSHLSSPFPPALNPSQHQGLFQ